MTLRAGWALHRIADLGIVEGGRQVSPHYSAGTLRPYLRVANIQHGHIDASDLKHMLFTDAEFKRFRLRSGDVLLNEGQSLELVGRAALYEGVPEECGFQNTLVRFRPGEQILPEFALILFEALHRQGRFAAIASRTTSIAHLGVERFAGLRVSLPPLREQRDIATIGSALEDAVRVLARLLHAKRRFKQGLAQQTFSELGARYTPTRLSAHSIELFERNKSGLGREWVMGVIKGVGLMPMRERIRVGDLARYKDVPPDAFAYNPMRINIGSIARNTSDRTCVVSPDYVVFQTDPDSLLPEYLDQLRHTRLWQDHMARAGAGGVRIRIYFRDLAEIRFPLPPLEEQRRIANLLASIDNEIATLERLADAYAKLRSALLDKLLSGEIPIPAS